MTTPNYPPFGGPNPPEPTPQFPPAEGSGDFYSPSYTPPPSGPSVPNPYDLATGYPPGPSTENLSPYNPAPAYGYVAPETPSAQTPNFGYQPQDSLPTYGDVPGVYNNPPYGQGTAAYPEPNFNTYQTPASPPVYGYGYSGPAPDNYLVWSILSTLFCCWPVGIASIVFSSQVNTKWAQGDYAGAQESSAKAKKFAIISAIVGAIVLVLTGIFYGIVIWANI